MTGEFAPGWLALREPADAAARAADLLPPLLDHLQSRPLVVCDLGCGTGSMARWLAGRLPGPQHWLLCDRDPDLLDLAAARPPGSTADGTPVSVATRCRDLTTLTAADLTGVGLVTASALLDLLTGDEVDRLVEACVRAHCPALLTLSVTGRVELTPADPLDPELTAAFNAHQHRTVDGRRLLGPAAVAAASATFERLGATVHVRDSPWRLGPDHTGLAVEWLRGWVAAACEQQPALAGPATGYLTRRLAAAHAGELRVVVGHQDLLARCPKLREVMLS